MKQNEKFLVYAVTGFLMVVIVVAVVFGRERPAQAGTQSRTDGSAAAGDAKLMSLADLVPPRTPAGGDAPGAAGEPAATGAAGVGLPAPGPIGLQPLATPPAPPTTPAALLVEKLGPSRREGDFRLVQARPRDTLSGLVQQWCGKVEGYLDEARSLNEGLATLQPGQTVLLPWVDDEAVLAAYEARQPRAPRLESTETPRVGAPGAVTAPEFAMPKPSGAAGRNTGGTSSEAPAPTATGASRLYTVKSGDKLWTLAEQEVGRREAPGFIAAVRALNPDVDVDRLKVGQQIRLPLRKS